MLHAYPIRTAPTTLALFACFLKESASLQVIPSLLSFAILSEISMTSIY